MWRSIWDIKINCTTVILLNLFLNKSLSGQLPHNQITHLPNHHITKLPAEQVSISSYLPKKGEIGAWQPIGAPEKAIGEDLFLLINGGAEIYQEYGFRQVVMQQYQNDKGKSINLEVYEMNDPASAFGIYTFKSSAEGRELPFGDGALLEEYYLNLWKGNFLVTLTGFDSDQQTIDGLIAIARAIDLKIKISGEKPALANLLPEQNLKKSAIKYLKGNLALFNNYEFGTGDLFGLKEGIIGNYNHYKVFIFKYTDQNESELWFKNARDRLESETKFHVYDMPFFSDYSVLNKSQDRIFMKLYKEYLIIVVGTTTIEGNKIIEEVQTKINSD